MNAKRAAAVVAAIALIAAALTIRRMIDDDGEAVAPPGSTAPNTELGSVVCITELAVVCEALTDGGLDVSVEPGLVTLDRLAAAAGDEAPVWITVDPFPAMVDQLRTRANRPAIDWAAEGAGASALAIAVPAGRLAPLETACAATPTWRCIGDADSWRELGSTGSLNVGFGDADVSASALAGIAAATAGYFGRTDVVASDFDAEAGFRVWLRGLVRSTSLTALSGGTPLATMLTRPAVNVAATYDAQISALPAAATRVDANSPRPAMWLRAVVAVPAGATAPEGLTTTATDTLTDAGWRPDGEAEGSLLRPNTMLALRALWQEAR